MSDLPPKLHRWTVIHQVVRLAGIGMFAILAAANFTKGNHGTAALQALGLIVCAAIELHLRRRPP
jgi:Na+/H+-dicarboxylate symporter